MRITVAKGDGIGPEIMDATLAILEAAGADLTYDFIDVGEKVYLSGNTAGIEAESWDIIRRNKVFLSHRLQPRRVAATKASTYPPANFWVSMPMFGLVLACIPWFVRLIL